MVDSGRPKGRLNEEMGALLGLYWKSEEGGDELGVSTVLCVEDRAGSVVVVGEEIPSWLKRSSKLALKGAAVSLKVTG